MLTALIAAEEYDAMNRAWHREMYLELPPLPGQKPQGLLPLLQARTAVWEARQTALRAVGYTGREEL
jgi:hypothetical protein